MGFEDDPLSGRVRMNPSGCPKIKDGMDSQSWMSRWKLGSKVSKWLTTYLKIGYMGVITHLLSTY